MNRFTMISAILGFAGIVAGSAWIYRPLGPIAAGVMLMALAFSTARPKSKRAS